MSKTLNITNLLIYLSYFIIILFFMFPIFWTLSLSLKTVPEIFSSPPLWFSKDPQFENYLYVLQNTEILSNLWNSFIIVVCTVSLVLCIAVPAAYGFSRFSFKGRKTSLFSVLVFQMVSPVIVAIPLYRFFSEMGWLNNYGSLIFVYVAIELPFAVWFLKGFFDTIPKELDEAGVIDGCSRLQVVLKILLPVVSPGVASVAILASVQSWSQFVIPFILLDDSDFYPVSVGLVNLKSTSEAITTHYLAAGSIIGILPVIILFVFLQRYIVGALTSGSVKG